MRIAATLLAVALASAPANLAGQSQPSEDPRGLFLALRAGAAFPSGRFREEVKPAPGFGIEAIVRPLRSIALYAGYANSEHRSSWQLDFPSGNATIGVSGFDAGARLFLPMGRISPWIGGGIIYKEVWLDAGSWAGGDTKHTRGREVGGGAGYVLNRRIALTADVRYSAFEPRQTLPLFTEATWDVPDVNLVLVQIGIAARVSGLLSTDQSGIPADRRSSPRDR
jgi:hypothetical protein